MNAISFKEKQRDMDSLRQEVKIIAHNKLQQISDKGYLSKWNQSHSHIKVWNLIGLGFIRKYMEFEHQRVELLEEKNEFLNIKNLTIF